MNTVTRTTVDHARPAARRNQAERSQATQQDLIAATIKVIAERGLENASTFEIAKAAGVTQGALQHHFQNKKALILRAATELVHSDDHNGTISFWPDAQLPLRQRAEDAISAAWRLIYGRPSYMTMWSIFLACRTDPELLHHLAVERETLRVRMAGGFLQAFPELDGVEGHDSLANLIFSAMRGMGVQEMFRPPPQLCAGQRAILVDLLVMRCAQNQAGSAALPPYPRRARSARRPSPG